MVTTISKPAYPNVPAAPGVPAVKRPSGISVSGVINQASLLVSDIQTVLNMFAAPQWGIFDAGGALVIEPDTIRSVELRADASIADYPVEQGAFASYNKVQRPNAVRIVMSKGGAVSDRTDMLAAIETAKQSLSLYSAVTPEATYADMNVEHYNYARTESAGAGMLTVEIWLAEVRVTGESTFTAAQQPAGAANSNTGTVQPADATTAQSALAGLAG